MADGVAATRDGLTKSVKESNHGSDTKLASEKCAQYQCRIAGIQRRFFNVNRVEALYDGRNSRRAATGASRVLRVKRSAAITALLFQGDYWGRLSRCLVFSFGAI